MRVEITVLGMVESSLLRMERKLEFAKYSGGGPPESPGSEVREEEVWNTFEVASIAGQQSGAVREHNPGDKEVSHTDHDPGALELYAQFGCLPRHVFNKLKDGDRLKQGLGWCVFLGLAGA